MVPAISASADLVGLLRTRAKLRPDGTAYRFLDGDGEEADHLTFGALDRRARTLAVGLRDLGLATGQERVLLVFPPGLDFIVSLFACLYSAMVGVPAYPPRSRGQDPRFVSIVEDARPAAMLTTSDLLQRVERRAEELTGTTVPGMAVEDVVADGAGWRRPPIRPEDPAFLQYTSGSTSEPKGVMVSHRSLLHNESLIESAFGQDESSVVVSWLPLFHDMGLIGTVLQPLFVGAQSVLMSPVSFLRRPVRWLQAIHRYRATTSGGPDFAYELCVERVGEEEKRDLDLSYWRVAFNGAEPVRPDTLDRFAAAFAPCGFDRAAFLPCYGLAEATLFVTGDGSVRPRSLALDPRALERRRVEPVAAGGAGRRLQSCGPPPPQVEVVIVDPETEAAQPPDRVGEIWVAGDSVAGGYWNRPRLSERTFRAHTADGAGPYLRTGDLGFLHCGELFVTGRLKDLIIVRGRNHAPHDLELTAGGAHPEVRSGAAFAVEVDGAETVVLVLEVDRHRRAGVEEIAAAVRAAVADGHRLRVRDVVLVRPGGLPRTTSGKVRRHACRNVYLEGELAEVGRSTLDGSGTGRLAEGPYPDRGHFANLSADPADSVLRGWLRQTVAAALRVAPDAVEGGETLAVLGLDSLAAAEIQHAVERELKVPAPPPHRLLEATLNGLAEELARRRSEGRRAAPFASPPRRDAGGAGEAGDAVADAGPASHGQRALWFHHELAPESGAYNLAVAVRLVDGIDPPALGRALLTVAARHPALRTTLEPAEDSLLQKVATEPALDYAVEQADSLSDEELERRMSAVAWRPFDLRCGPLLRARLWRRETGSVLLVAVHHAVADFASLAVVADDLGAAYGHARGRSELPAPASAPTYLDYSRWEAAWVEGEEGDRQLEFWRRRLEDGRSPLDLPTDRPRPSHPSFRGAAEGMRCDGEVAVPLAHLARRSGAGLHTLLLTVFATLLYRWSGQGRFVLGTPTAGRPAPELRRVVGHFVNPVPVSVDLSGNLPFAELVDRMTERVREALDHGTYPFSRIADRLRQRFDPSRAPIYQVLFSWQAAPPGSPTGLAALAVSEAGRRIDLGPLRGESLRLPTRFAELDLTLTVAGDEAGLGLDLRYATDLFDAPTVRRMLDHMQVLASAVVADPGRPLGALPLMTEEERRQVTRWPERAGLELPRAALHDLFLRSARRWPEATAVQWGDVSLTYAVLEEESRRLATRLADIGVSTGARVGVFLEPSSAAVTAILGVLRAGAAYVPLDPEFPADRLAYMVDDAAPAALVTVAARRPELPPTEVPVVLLDGDAGTADWGMPSSALADGGAPDLRPAYRLYTSGSTGRPKGVEVPHRAVVSFIEAMARRPGFEPGETLVSVTTLSFDISVLELFLPLARGGRVVVAEREVASDGRRLAALLKDSRAAVMQATPATWKLLLAAGWSGLPGLRALCGGEAMTRDLAQRLVATGVELWNMYGPTEATVWCNVSRVTPGDGDVPIGEPVAHATAYVLDDGWRPVPFALVGELYVGGAGLASGYPGRPAATAAAFVPDRFGREPGGRLYRTGDLARRTADGELYCLGRRDRQIKLRGHRIEPGEIEAALRTHPAVRDAAVAAPRLAGGDRNLAAWVVAAGAAPSAAELRGHLAARLPEYMLPGVFVPLPALPLTPNGKVDVDRLPQPAPEGEDGGDLETPLERLVADLWCELLGASRVGPEDDFFTLGGHSLSAARLAARLCERLGVTISLRELLRRPTVRGVAVAVEAACRHPGEAPAEVREPALEASAAAEPVLSYGQERLWLFEQLAPGGAAYLMPAAVHLHGRLDIAALSTALNDLVARHPVLRTAVPSRGGRPAPRYDDARTELPLIDLSALADAVGEASRLAAAEARRSIDLARAPLLRGRLVRLSADSHRLLVTVHHVAADGGSLPLFAAHLAASYRAALERAPAPPHPGLTYADFALWQRRAVESGAWSGALDFWRRQLAGLPPFQIPGDRPRPAVRSFRGGRVTLRSAQVQEKLAARGRELGATPFIVLLAAFLALLGRFARRSDLAVGTPFTLRDRPRLESVIGFFANTVPIRASLAGDPTFAELVARLRDTVLDVHEHRRYPFERVVEELAEEGLVGRDPAQDPLFPVTFAEGADLPALGLPGLEMTVHEVVNGSAKFDLSAIATAGGGDLVVHLEYAADLLERVTVERFGAALVELLGGALRQPETPLSALPVLAPGERNGLCGTRRPLAARPVHLRVVDQAERSPDAVAVSSGAESLTYGDLERRSRRLAAALAGDGVGRGDLVALLLPRVADLVVAALATLRCGAAYLPLDPELPPRRVTELVCRSRALRVVAQPGADLPPGLPPVVDPVTAATPEATSPAAAPLDRELTGDDLAYVIYTSGSTGVPKGVAVPHRGLSNLVDWHLRYHRVAAGHRASHLAGLGFDASVWEVWPYLVAGATVHLVPGGVTTRPGELVAWLRQAGITHCFLPTALAEAVMADGPPELPELRVLLTGGDRLHRSPGVEPPFRYVNHYGPTESSVVSTAGVVSPACAKPPPIGVPVDNLDARFLDAALRPAVPGGIGELFVGGPAVACGYLGSAARTAERFVPDPWAGTPGARLYRTGDLVRLGAGGELEFLGRVDQQVQVRGFRIEPGEVEARLTEHADVRQAAVVPRGEADEVRMVAYVTTARSVDGAELARFLSSRLPAYMVPSDFVELPSLPLNSSGKVDRAALPEVDGGAATTYVAPRSGVEEVLAGICGELLQVERVGAHDSFLALGGHSLHVTRLVARVEQEFGVELSPRRVFLTPTVAGLAEAVAEALLAASEPKLAAEALRRAEGGGDA